MTIFEIISMFAEVAAFATSVFYRKELKVQKWLLFIPYLAITCTLEIWSAYWWITTQKPTLWLYNPYIVLSILFYGYILIQASIITPAKKKLLYQSLILLSVSALTWYYIWGDPTVIINHILNGGALIICLLCFLFFYTHIRHPHYHFSLAKAPGFWVAAGLLVFYAGISLNISVYNFLAAAQIRLWKTPIQNLIPQALSLFLYSFIIIAFKLCKYPSRK